MLISLFFVPHPPPGKLRAGRNFRLVVKFRDDLTNSRARVKLRVVYRGCTVKSRLHPKREWSRARSKSSVGTKTARHNGRLIKIPGCILCSRDGGHLARRHGEKLKRKEGERAALPVGEPAGYGRGKATRLSRGLGLISPHLHPRLLTDVDIRTTNAFHRDDFGFHPFAGLVHPLPLLGPVPRTKR